MNPPSAAETIPSSPADKLQAENQCDSASTSQLLWFYEQMFTARQLDALENELTQRGEAFFHVSGAGHEAGVALAPCLGPQDWLHCHYRDKALLLARGITPDQFFLSLLCKTDSHSQGRQMSAHLSAPELNVLSMVGPVGNNALQAVGVAKAVRQRPGQPIVLCAMGDGTTQQGEVLEAIAEAVRHTLPVLFLIEDNRLAISTSTAGRTFFETPDGPSREFYGLPIERIDGCDVAAAHTRFKRLVDELRRTRRPALVVIAMERLANHTNADDQSVYRSDDAIRSGRQVRDPLLTARAALLAARVDEWRLEALEQRIAQNVRAAAERARRASDPAPIFTALKPLPAHLDDPANEYRGDSREPRLTMLQALRETLRARMAADPRVHLYGEDLEDPKGDVFGLTRGLTQEFGPRVENSALAEATIIGVSIGRALAGERPVAFLQFADFLPIAFNQILSELGSLWWRSAGAWQAPVIVMITCGGYRPGLGPFHAQTLEALAAHTPGVDVMMPATAGDAAGLLNAAFASERPTLFFYPKSCLNDRNAATSPDVARHLVPLGRARIVRGGSDVTLVGYGNAVGLCLKAADGLELAGRRAEVIDLRCIQPWDAGLVLRSAEKTGRLIVVHEDNHTCGMGAEILATVAERSTRPIVMRRLTRADTYVPCNFANQLEVLPSYKRVLETAADLLGYDVAWERPPAVPPGQFIVEAVGSSPSDESVTMLDWYVRVGDEVYAGQVIAQLEADKALVELSAPISGTVASLEVARTEMVKVGAPLLVLHTSEELIHKPPTQEQPGTPILRRRAAPAPDPSAFPGATASIALRTDFTPQLKPVGISRVVPACGGRRVENSDLLPFFNSYSDDDIVRRTGIDARCRVAEGETALTLATHAARECLAGENLHVTDLDAVIVATGTPQMITPSMACLLLNELAGGAEANALAYDINAACSGYLYALQSGFDFLQSHPTGRVLVVTTEVVSPLLDPADFGTSIIFGDAASATLLYGAGEIHRAAARLLRPELSAKPEDGRSICVPLPGRGTLSMDGQKVFSEAVRKMINMLERACSRHELALEDLALIVPHQANQRIIDAIRSRIKFAEERVYTNIRTHGNTSSSTIPLCLAEVLPQRSAGEKIGLCAFGGGFTFGAGVLEVL